MIKDSTAEITSDTITRVVIPQISTKSCDLRVKDHKSKICTLQIYNRRYYFWAKMLPLCRNCASHNLPAIRYSCSPSSHYENVEDSLMKHATQSL